jgi:fatty acid desaturase
VPGFIPPFFRYRADAPGALIVGAAVATMVVGAAGLVPWWFVVPLLFGLRWTGLVQHNHNHLPLFRPRAANLAFDAVLTFASAVPQPIYRYIHHEVHHRYLNEPAD